MGTLGFKSGLALGEMIRKGEIGAEELLEYYLKRVSRFNPKLNAVIQMIEDSARERARDADRARARGTFWGPFHGVPMTIKESFDVAGMHTTRGNLALKDNIATQDALAVTRLKNAGVTLFGKTNVPLNLADFQSYNDIYGTTNNPWDLGRNAGDPPVAPPPPWLPAWPGWKTARISAAPFETQPITAASSGTSRPGASCRPGAMRRRGCSPSPTSR